MSSAEALNQQMPPKICIGAKKLFTLKIKYLASKQTGRCHHHMYEVDCRSSSVESTREADIKTWPR